MSTMLNMSTMLKDFANLQHTSTLTDSTSSGSASRLLMLVQITVAYQDLLRTTHHEIKTDYQCMPFAVCQ